jgi:hypothetical protein
MISRSFRDLRRRTRSSSRVTVDRPCADRVCVRGRLVDYRLEHHPEFLRRVAAARVALRGGRGAPLDDIR